ncbi:unnamed protein product [Sphagnum troendelagicum]|uniref:Floricaula/leafy-like transcription factor n=1 Tax=Sphagnum jensenii TaxID=128206 RepID=A0ABP0WCF9_9BRYO
MEELHINVDEKAESQLTKRKQEEKTEGGVIEASSKKSCENGTDNRLRMKGKEKMTAVEQVFIGNELLFQARAVRLVNFFSVSLSASQTPGAPPAPDLETFFEGFGVKGETIAKLKELGFTSKAITANFDELPLIVVSIKQHSCHLTIEEEQGIKCAAKYWQKGIIKMMAVEQKWKEKMTALEQGIKCTAKHWQKEENSPVIRVSGDNKGDSSSQTEGQSQQTSTGQGIRAVPAGNTHEAPFSNQRAEMPEDASTDLSMGDWLAMGDLDIVKQYPEFKLSDQHCNLPAKTISGNELVASNGWVPGFGVSEDGHIEAIFDFDALFDTSSQRK